MIEKLHPQNHTVVQEEDQHGIVTSIVTVIILNNKDAISACIY